MKISVSQVRERVSGQVGDHIQGQVMRQAIQIEHQILNRIERQAWVPIHKRVWSRIPTLIGIHIERHIHD